MQEGKRDGKRGIFGHGKKFIKQLLKPNNPRRKEQSSVSDEASPRTSVTSSDVFATTSNLPAEVATSFVAPVQDLSSAQTIQKSPPDLGLWGKAADSLDPPDRKRLESLVRYNQEASENYSADSQSGHFDLELVFSKASDLKDGEKKADWIRVIDKIVNAAIRFKSLGDAAVQFDKSGYAALGWSVVSCGLEVAANARDMREFVISSSEVVARFLVKYREYETFRGSDGGEEYDHCLTKVYKAILLYEIELNDYFRQSPPEHLMRAGCKVDDSSISQCKKAIHDADAHVTAWVNIIMVKSNNNISLLVQRMLDQTSPNLSDPTQKCMQSLAFPEMEDRYQDIERPAEGTCTWLVAHEIYRNWAGSDRSLLWIRGKPGSGKSTLLRYALDDAIVASNIQDRSLHHRSKRSLGNSKTAGTRAETSALILSFFFHGRGVELQRTPLGFSRSLLHQLLKYAPDALSGLVATYQAKCTSMGAPGEKWYWRPNELADILQLSIQEVSKSRPVWLFVDALDECGIDNAKEVVGRFESLLRGCASTAHFHICFSCRQYPVLSLNQSPPDAFEICPDHENRDDISTYAKARLSNSLLGTTEAIKAIADQASGVFMWARLVVERILDLEREGDTWSIQTDIHDRPQQLDDLYKDLIQEMKDKPSSLKLFQWICFARRPLSLDELLWAMIVEADCSKTTLRQYGTKEGYTGDMEKKLKTLSCGLAEVTMSSDGQQPVVQFIHQSVKDFVMDKGLPALHEGPNLAIFDTYGPKAYIEGIAQLRLSRICLCYVRAEEIAQSAKVITHEPGSLKNMAESERKALLHDWSQRFPLLQYATSSWIDHVDLSRKAGISQDDLLEYLGWPLEATMQLSTQIYLAMESELSRRIENPLGTIGTTILHVISRSGWEELLRKILKSRDHLPIDVTNESGQTPLYQAARMGQYATARLLIEHGANMNAQATLYRYPTNALQVASSEGYEQIVRILLEHGADVNAQVGDVGSALGGASYYGHEKIVNILLEHGADVNAQGRDYGSALQAASYQKHEIIVRILLQHGADVNFRGGRRGYALHAASLQGDEQIVRLLLEHGADVNAHGGYYGYALQAASFTKHEQIVRILLKHGADINVQGGRYGYALQAASHNGYEQNVRILLEQGADVNAQAGSYDYERFRPILYEEVRQVFRLSRAKQGHNAQRVFARLSDRSGNTALIRAAEWGHLKVVQELVAAIGIDLNISEEDGNTALIRAAEWGHLKVVQELVAAIGIDLNASNNSGRTALSLAAGLGHLEVVQALVAATGIDLNASNNSGRTALSFAAGLGRREAVRELVAGGADLKALDEEGRNALFNAAESGRLEVVRELVAAGADLNASSNSGRTALSFAAGLGRLEVVRELVAAGADLKALDEQGRNALFNAAESGWSHVFNYLLQIQSLDTDSQSGLHDSLRRGLLIHVIRGGNEANVREVLSRTDDQELNQRDHYGMTPLSVAAARGQHRIVELLLQDPRIDIQPEQTRDTLGRSVMWWAKSSGEEELVKILRSHGQSICRCDGEVPVLDLRARPADASGGYCDLCIRDVKRGDGYRCKLCWPNSGVNFVICPDCFLLGGRCLDASHHLLYDGRQK